MEVLTTARTARSDNVRESPLTVRVNSDPTVTTVHLIGALDMTCAPRMARTVDQLLEDSPHGVVLDGTDLFHTHVRLHGGPAPVRRYLPELIDLVLRGEIHPGKVFDLTLPLDAVAEGYRAMDERRAIKTLLRP